MWVFISVIFFLCMCLYTTALWRETTAKVWSKIPSVIPEPCNPDVVFFPHIHLVSFLPFPSMPGTFGLIRPLYCIFCSQTEVQAASTSKKCTYTAQVNLGIFSPFCFFSLCFKTDMLHQNFHFGALHTNYSNTPFLFSIPGLKLLHRVSVLFEDGVHISKENSWDGDRE